MPEEVKKDEKQGGQFEREKEQRQRIGKHTDEGEESRASQSLQATVWNLNVVPHKWKCETAPPLFLSAQTKHCFPSFSSHPLSRFLCLLLGNRMSCREHAAEAALHVL